MSGAMATKDDMKLHKRYDQVYMLNYTVQIAQSL